jgi:hypothetical protein
VTSSLEIASANEIETAPDSRWPTTDLQVALFPKRTSLAVSTFSEGAHVNSTLKIQKSEAMTLIEKIKTELKKRAEAKAKRMLFKKPKRLAKRCS